MSQTRRKTKAESGGLRHRVLDEVRFLRNWVERPLSVGAVAPSSPQLARLMASYVETERSGSVAELGPGTGVVTEALLKHGVAPERIVAVEYGAEFVGHLRARFPKVSILHGDAFALKRTLGTHADKPLAAVVSSLPLFTRPPAQRLRLIEEALDLLAPGAPFIQFSYAFVPPVAPGQGRFELERSNWVVFNLPPARVWIYRRP